MDLFVMFSLIHNWISRNSYFSCEKKKSIQNGIKTSPSNLITTGYEKLTLGLPDVNTYHCHRIGCTLSSPLFFPTFCTFFVLKRCMFSFPLINIFPNYPKFKIIIIKSIGKLLHVRKILDILWPLESRGKHVIFQYVKVTFHVLQEMRESYTYHINPNI